MTKTLKLPERNEPWREVATGVAYRVLGVATDPKGTEHVVYAAVEPGNGPLLVQSLKQFMKTLRFAPEMMYGR